jgi:hypothetical protein
LRFPHTIDTGYRTSVQRPHPARPVRNSEEIMLPDRYGTVLTLMRLSIASPQLPYPYKAGRMPGSLYELVKALRNAPVGSWLSVNLAALPGSTLAAKQSSTARAARRLFYPIQTQIKGSRLFVRRVPNPGYYPARPIDCKRRPIFSESLSDFGVTSRTG